MSSTARDTERVVYGCWKRGARATSATHVVAHRGRRLCQGRWRGYRRPMASRPLREASAEWGDFVEVPTREQISWAHLLYR
jgi:hypothetical protein